jgi:hypothetical protein
MPDQPTTVRQRWSNLQQSQVSKTTLFWSCAGCVVVALVVGFTWGGWVTGGTARQMAVTAGDEARFDLASVICVDRFVAAPDARAKLIELKAIDSSFRQREFIEQGGWATMPGSTTAARQAAVICARVLSNLELEELEEIEELAGTAEPVGVAAPQ